MRILLLLAVLATPLRLSADEAHTPKVGSEERKAILEAVRDPVEDTLHQKQSIT